MEADLYSYIARLKKVTDKTELKKIKLDLIGYFISLGEKYAANLQLYSDAVIREKEEWYKSSMTECVHRAGRTTGYQHEADKVELEAARAMMGLISDMESEDQAEWVSLETETDNSPETT